MAIHKTEAFVIKTQPFRSSSLIVTVFSQSFGKLRGVVKGVRKERELRGADYELFTHLEIVFYEKTRSDLHLISDAAILESNDGLRTRLPAIVYASYFSELVDSFFEVHESHPPVFELLKFAFRFLPSISEEKLSRLFEISLLREVGWVPYLDHCLKCQTPLEQGFFSAVQGALFCANCARQHPDAKPIRAEALSVLRYYLDHPLEESIKLKMTQQTEHELGLLMERFLTFRFNTPLKTRSFLSQIQPLLKNN